MAVEDSGEGKMPWLSEKFSKVPFEKLSEVISGATRGDDSELWTINVPRMVDIDILKSSKWRQDSNDTMRWRSEIDGSTYVMEEDISSKRLFLLDTDGIDILPAQTVRNLIIRKAVD
eukprot:jgi/Picsp_1/2820/NSC_01046-R1_---NA---